MGTAITGATSGAAGFRTLQRQLAAALAQGGPSRTDGPTLEARRANTGEPPRLARAAVLEGTVVQRRPVPGEPEVGFSAFLDGIQASRVLLYDSAVPIVHGSVAAVIRIRRDRRLTTWEHAGESRVYAPRGFLSAEANGTLTDSGAEIVDTTPRRSDGEPDDDGRHPLTLSEAAVSAAQNHREALELRLAESWCDREGSSALYVDGGISGSVRLATSTAVIGVVKSHRLLYGDPAAVRAILTLGAGERSSVFTVASPNRWRSPVASWYLRLREADAHDPLWGLVRVETAPPAAGIATSIGSRADQISRWILAEASPLALPDGRWDTMVYGIRDCEQFLRSIH